MKRTYHIEKITGDNRRPGMEHQEGYLNIDLAEMDNEAVRKALRSDNIYFQDNIKMEVDNMGHDITKTEVFKEWFLGSKVVDKRGKPLLVYHGTDAEFDVFDFARGGQNFNDSNSKEGAFFTSSKGYAEHYGSNIVEAYIKLINPVIINVTEQIREEYKYLVDSGEYKGSFKSFLAKNDPVEIMEPGYYSVISDAKANGNDGVIFDYGSLIQTEGSLRGIPAGKVIVVFDSSQTKSAIGNRGTFDPANPNILFQEDGEHRGFFDLSSNTIGLLENADLSTFLHESAHFYFQVLQDLASRPDAPQQIKDDYQLLLDWFGTDQPQTEHLEMFARGFEQYLGEGKAPTPELQSAFQRFKAWIAQVYRNLKNLNVPLSDEVRGVFDRLLATDEEIAQARDALLAAYRAGMAATEGGDR